MGQEPWHKKEHDRKVPKSRGLQGELAQRTGDQAYHGRKGHADKEQEWNEGSWEQEAYIRDSRGVYTELRSITEWKRRNGEALQWARTVTERDSGEGAGPEMHENPGDQHSLATLVRIFLLANSGVSSP